MAKFNDESRALALGQQARPKPSLMGRMGRMIPGRKTAKRAYDALPDGDEVIEHAPKVAVAAGAGFAARKGFRWFMGR